MILDYYLCLSRFGLFIYVCIVLDSLIIMGDDKKDAKTAVRKSLPRAVKALPKTDDASKKSAAKGGKDKGKK
jgi:hypothetical protein